MDTDWRKVVYTPAETYDKKAWAKLSGQIKRRDHYRCARCDKKFNQKDLTVHHVFPRASGGSDDPENLISLCSPCHDIVEEKQLKTIMQIRCDLIQEQAIEDDQTIEYQDARSNYWRNMTYWRSWVYGAGVIRHKKH